MNTKPVSSSAQHGHRDSLWNDANNFSIHGRARTHVAVDTSTHAAGCGRTSCRALRKQIRKTITARNLVPPVGDSTRLQLSTGSKRSDDAAVGRASQIHANASLNTARRKRSGRWSRRRGHTRRRRNSSTVTATVAEKNGNIGCPVDVIADTTASTRF